MENYKKLSALRKVMLLEENVCSGDIERVKEVLDGCGEFEFTARALGFACRFASLEMAQTLVNAGASFAYDYCNSVLQGKYSFCDNVKYRWGEHAQFELMVLADNLHNAERFGWLSNAPYDVRDRDPIPEEERLEILRWLCTSKKAKCDQSAMLYFGILWDKREAVKILRENGAKFGGFQELSELKSPQASHRRKALVGALEAMEPKRREWAVSTLLDVLKDQGEKLAVSPSMFDLSLFSQPLIKRLIDEGVYSKLDNAKMVKGAVEKGSAATLAMFLELGFLKTPALRDQLIEQSIAVRKPEHTAVLLDYKNRTADLEKEAAAKEARDQRDLTADVNSVYMLKKTWAYKKQKDGTLRITGYKGPGGVVEVPAKIGRAQVTAIGTEVFATGKPWRPEARLTEEQWKAHEYITEVILPEGIQEIGDDAFSGSRIARIQLPKSVTVIGCNAFAGCRRLSEIELPPKLKKIEACTFQYCSRLTQITVPKSVREIGHGAFWDCKLKNITFLGKDTRIDKHTFGDIRVTIHAPAGSSAEEYAKENRLAFEAIAGSHRG